MLASIPSTGSEPAASNDVPFFVCVHIGAGYHAIENERAYRRVMAHACRAAAEVMTSHGSVDEAVVRAIVILEESELTNAGRGSNLNEEGEVECDASIMTGGGIFGAVGAAAGIAHPIRVAHRLATLSQEPLSHGRVRPMYALNGEVWRCRGCSFLAGDGVRRWAARQGMEAARDEEGRRKMHVTEASLNRWTRYKEMLEGNEELPKTVQDTVGCIVVNASGEVCSGVSSGGLAMKTPGRIGEAALYGAGCWARNATPSNTSSIACSVSGVGEIVARGLIARSCAEALTDGTPLDFVKDVIEHHTKNLNHPKEIGVISVSGSSIESKEGNELQVELCVVHNTESMGFAYLTAGSKTAVRFLRHEGNNGSFVEYGACTKWALPEDEA